MWSCCLFQCLCHRNGAETFWNPSDYWDPIYIAAPPRGKLGSKKGKAKQNSEMLFCTSAPVLHWRNTIKCSVDCIRGLMTSSPTQFIYSEVTDRIEIVFEVFSFLMPQGMARRWTLSLWKNFLAAAWFTVSSNPWLEESGNLVALMGI